MNTVIFQTGETSVKETIQECAKILKQGGLVAFPTETVYGLGGNGLDAKASEKIYAAKGRPSDNPLILHIGKKEQLYDLVTEVPETAEKLMTAFWPGPLTIILKKADIVPKETSGGLSTVAVRMPSHPVANALLIEAGIPVAAPSANLSGRPSTTRASHVIEDLSGRVDAIIDGGDVPIGVESTIVDLTGEVPMLLRPGFITAEDIEKVIGPVETDRAIRKESIIAHTNEVLHPKAPGMKYRHYAPKAPLTIVTGEAEKVAEAILKNTDDETGILTLDEHRELYSKGQILSVGSLKKPETVVHNLFDVLRQLDEMNVRRIYSEDLTSCDTGEAVMNRLLKAAGGDYRKAEEL